MWAWAGWGGVSGCCLRRSVVARGTALYLMQSCMTHVWLMTHGSCRCWARADAGLYCQLSGIQLVPPTETALLQVQLMRYATLPAHDLLLRRGSVRAAAGPRAAVAVAASPCDGCSYERRCASVLPVRAAGDAERWLTAPPAATGGGGLHG